MDVKFRVSKIREFKTQNIHKLLANNLQQENSKPFFNFGIFEQVHLCPIGGYKQ